MHLVDPSNIAKKYKAIPTTIITHSSGNLFGINGIESSEKISLVMVFDLFLSFS